MCLSKNVMIHVYQEKCTLESKLKIKSWERIGIIKK